jgi:5'-deoxynucleotidase YfbR-like HD superfamily hydrolase
MDKILADTLGCYHDAPTAIETYMGGRFDVENPREEDVNVLDIAHSLANTGRYGGHANRFYSVCAHSIFCHDEAVRRAEVPLVRLMCLLHDAAEAYMGDLGRPIRTSTKMDGYNEMMDAIELVVYRRFGCIETIVRKYWKWWYYRSPKRAKKGFLNRLRIYGVVV